MEGGVGQQVYVYFCLHIHTIHISISIAYICIICSYIFTIDIHPISIYVYTIYMLL